MQVENDLISVEYDLICSDTPQSTSECEVKKAMLSKTGNETFILIDPITTQFIFKNYVLLEEIHIVADKLFRCLAVDYNNEDTKVSSHFHEDKISVLILKWEKPKKEINSITLKFEPIDNSNAPEIGRIIFYSRKREKGQKPKNYQSKNQSSFPFVYQSYNNLKKEKPVKKDLKPKVEFPDEGSIICIDTPPIPREKVQIKFNDPKITSEARKEITVNGKLYPGGRKGNTFQEILDKHIEKEYTSDGCTPFSDMFILNTAYIDPKVQDYENILGFTKALGAFIVDNIRFADYVISNNLEFDRSQAPKAIYVFSSFMRDNWEKEELQNIESYILPKD